MSSEAIVNLIVNADDAEGRIDAQLRTIANDAERTAPRIDLRVNIDNASVVTALDRQTDLLSRSLDGVNDNLRQTNLLLSRIGDNDGLRRVGDDADSADRDTNRLNLSFGDLSTSMLGAVASATRLTLIGGLASQAVPLVAGLATTVASIAPAAAAGVTGFVALKAASATLKIALLGVSDAVSAVFDPDADPAALEEALERLSDNARDFVLVLRDMRPAFDRLRIDIQDRTFRGLDAVLKQVASATFPALRRAAVQFADSFNAMARGVGRAAVDLGQSGTLGKALDSSTDAFEDLEDIPGQVLKAIGQLAAAGGPLLNKLTGAIERFADSASLRLNEAFESGRLEDAVNNAGDVIRQLGRIAGNVFGTIGNVIGVASEQGNGLFGTLEKLTQALEDATASEGFKDALSALIDVGQTLIDAILPIITEAFKILGPVIEELAPPVQEIVQLLGEKLLELLPVVAPLIEEIARLFGEVLKAVTPLIEEGIDLLIEIMPSLVELFEELTPLVREISPLILYFAVGAKEILVPAIEAVIEILKLFVIGVRATIGWINDIAEMFGVLVQAISGNVRPALDKLSQGLRGELSGAWGAFYTAANTMTLNIVPLILGMRDRAISLVSGMMDNITRVGRGGWSGFLQGAREMVRNVIRSIANMRSDIIRSVQNMASGMYRAGANMVSSLARGILSQLSSAISAARRVVGAIRDFFPSSPARRGPFSGRGYPLYSGRAIVDSLVEGMESRGHSLDRAMARLLNPGGALIAGTAGSLVTAGTGFVPDSTGFAGIANTTFARLTPNVNVYIGNRQLNDYMQVIVDENSMQRDRLAAQGVRSN